MSVERLQHLQHKKKTIPFVSGTKKKAYTTMVKQKLPYKKYVPKPCEPRVANISGVPFATTKFHSHWDAVAKPIWKALRRAGGISEQYVQTTGPQPN